MRKILFIGFSLFLMMSCQNDNSLTNPKPGNAEKTNSLSKTNVLSSAEFEIEMNGYGADLEGDPVNLDSRFKIGYEFSFNSDGYGHANRSNYTAYAISSSSGAEGSLNPKFQEQLLQNVNYNGSALTATFNGQTDNIDADQNFIDTFNFMQAEEQKVNNILGNIGQQAAQKAKIKALSPREYIGYLKKQGYNVVENQTTNTAVVSTTQETISNEEPMVINSYYNYDTGKYEKQDLLMNNILQYHKHYDGSSNNVVLEKANYYNKENAGRDASVNLTISKNY